MSTTLVSTSLGDLPGVVLGTSCFVNLMKHEVSVYDLEETGGDTCLLRVSPSGVEARRAPMPARACGLEGLPVSGRPAFGEVTNLPKPQEGVFLLVSMLVREGAPSRTDLLSPGKSRVRNGLTVGCHGLASNW